MGASLPTATFTGNALKRPAQAHVGVLDTGADVYVLMNILCYSYAMDTCLNIDHPRPIFESYSYKNHEFSVKTTPL